MKFDLTDASKLIKITVLSWIDCSQSAWVSWELSAILSTPVQGKTGMTLMKRLRCFVVGCNNEYSSRHLLPTSEPLKTQRITFVFKGNAPPDLPKYLSTFAHLADTFIQSDLQCIQAIIIIFLSVCVFPGNWTHNLLRC